MFCWKKLGRVFNPLEVKNRPWLNEFAQAPSVLVFDDFIRVYFICRPAPDTNGQYVSYPAYVDLDPSNLMRILNISKDPVIELGDVGAFDEFGIYPFSVIKHEKELRAFYGGWTRCESVRFNVAIGCAISTDDGVSFKKIGSGPILSYTPDEPFLIGSPKIRKFNNKWYLYYGAGHKWVMDGNRTEPVYKIRLATSDDGLNWTKINKDLISNILEKHECQASPDVIFANGKYHMFFSYRYNLNYMNKERGYRIGYASSDDGILWKRDDSKAGIDVSNDGWDSQMVSYSNVFELNGNIYMFYLGNNVGKEGFGLAILEGNL